MKFLEKRNVTLFYLVLFSQCLELDGMVGLEQP